MDKIKITHIIAPIDNYGKERWLLAFLKYLDRTKYETEVLILSKSENSLLAKSFETLGIKYKTLTGSGKINISDVQKIRNYLISNRTEILHSHDYKSDIFGYFASVGTQIRKVSTPHGWCGKGDLKLAFYELLDKTFLNLFDKVIPLSNKMASSLRIIQKRRVSIINNFIDLDRIPEPEEGDPYLITFMGRLVELKRVQDAIHAIKIVNNKKVNLQIIGDGPMREKLEFITKKLNLGGKINFLGHRQNSLELLNKSRIFILPSLTEGISRSVMEAMALKKIVISTNIPGINELVMHGENGFLVETKSPNAIAGMIDHILNNMHDAETIARKARKTIEKNHSAAKVVKDYEQLYSNLVS
ncbi:MAG: glycosyltransferase [Candidatus Krumholzibacteriota bacterium]|nr:glycosyltransferase [Candidatus Krumholzibacteriota bacterium]